MNPIARRLPHIRMALLWAAIALFEVSTALGGELRPFDAHSLAVIRSSHQGKPFVLAFWSIHCEPCRGEMAMWKAIRRKYPGLSIVLVTIDPPSEEPAISRFLKRHSPGPVETWAFADEFSERVRYAVDRTWRGELPRTYYFDASHRALVQSGLPDRKWVEDWLAQQAYADAKSTK